MSRAQRIPRWGEAAAVARSHGRLSYAPGLWRRLRGLWMPSLGSTGLTLHDLAGRAHNATLTDMELDTDWRITEKGWAVYPNGLGDQIHTAWSHGGVPQLTFLAYVRKTGGSSLAGTVGNGWTNQGWCFYYRNVAGAGHAFTVTTTSGQAYTRTGTQDTNWHLVGGQYDAGQTYAIVDKARVAGGSTSGLIPVNQPLVLVGDFNTGHGANFNGDIIFEAVWNRILTPAEIQHLYADPHAMVRPRRRTYSAATAAAASSVPIFDHHYRMMRAA